MGQQRGRGRPRGRGPDALAALTVMLLAGSGLVAVLAGYRLPAVLAGYRLPVVASRPSRVILALLAGVLWVGATQRF